MWRPETDEGRNILSTGAGQQDGFANALEGIDNSVSPSRQPRNHVHLPSDNQECYRPLTIEFGYSVCISAI